jgi:hypothetical protein
MARVSPDAVIAGLVKRGVPQHVAEGVVMNFQDESGLDTSIPGDNGNAYGLAQWNGPRRIRLQGEARARGVPVDDLDLQLDYFMQENAGPEAAAWKQVMAAPDRNSAAVAFVNQWERPATKHAVARTAKYSGARASPGSPYELQARHPQNPQVGTGGYVAPDAPTTQPGAAPPVAKVDTKDKYAAAIGKGIGGLAGMSAPVMGASGNMPALPQLESYAAEAMPIVSGGVNRDAMAMLMARLNSGQLWG